MKQTIFIDMDGVLCDAAKAFIWAKSGHTEIEYPESIPGVSKTSISFRMHFMR